ncbi:MAG: adenosine kinase [Spirochaetes bacterium]|jgi:sugar/nucleoside kinase (ribokinase family)|nr:adenosine kinase [Spirochaetota bacterium]
MNKNVLVLNREAGHDVVAMGSALLDFTVEVDDAFLGDLGLEKGRMQLIDEDRSREIFSRLRGHKMETTPGGSAANTAAGISNLGGNSVFLGMVGRDEYGDLYSRETEDAGVIPRIGRHDRMTGHAITFITPDSERSFATHLGAAQELTPDVVEEDVVRAGRIIHIEGYLFEPENLRAACYKALKIAKKSGVLVSIDLSDPSLIGRIHGVFSDVVREYADVVFVNEEEARAFTGKDAADALDMIYGMCRFAVVKLGSAGSMIKTGGETFRIPVYKTSVVNTNGAGDMYASGVLYGISRGLSPAEAGKIGSYASSLVVARPGARYNGRIDVSVI